MPKVSRVRIGRAAPYESQSKSVLPSMQYFPPANTSDDESSEESREKEQPDFHAYFTSRGSEIVGSCDNPKLMSEKMTADMVGKGFMVVYLLPPDDDDDDDDDEPQPSWTARVSLLEAINANEDSNHLELTFLHNEDFPVHSRKWDCHMTLERTITVARGGYFLFTVPPCMEKLVPRFPLSVSPDFAETLEGFGHRLLAPFSDYARVRSELVVGSTYFLVSHVPTTILEASPSADRSVEVLLRHAKEDGVEPGWVAYKTKFGGVDNCLGPSLPLLLFEYQKCIEDEEDGTPFISSTEVELANVDFDSPPTRVGPHVRFLLYSC